MKNVLLIATFAILLLTGCESSNILVKSKQDWEQEKKKIVEAQDQRAAKVIEDIKSKVEEEQRATKENLEKASALAYGINRIGDIKPAAERTRADDLISFKSKELVIRLPDLTMEAILEVNEELARELDEVNTSFADLQSRYEESVAQAKEDKKQLEALAIEIDKRKADLQDLEQQKKDALLRLAVLKSQSDEEEKARLAKEAADAQDRQNLIKYLIRIFIGISIAAAVGAALSRSLILAGASASAIALSIFIVYIQPWQAILFGTCVILVLVAGIVLKWRETQKREEKEKRLSNRLVGSIEEYKNKMGKEKFKEELGPVITQWTKDTPEAEAHIDTKLKEMNLKR